jgi:hypothetical protein
MLRLRQFFIIIVFIFIRLPLQAELTRLPVSSSPASAFKMWSMVTPHKSIVLADLSLYKFLMLVHFNIESSLKAHTSNSGGDVHTMRALAAALGIADKALSLLRDSVNAFNNHCLSYNPDIEARFYDLCTYFDKIGLAELEPRHLRSFCTSVVEFNSYISTYYQDRKKFLCKEDSELFEKLIKLNLILSAGLVRDDYISVAWYQKVTDWLVYRPLEFAQNHPLLTTAVCAVVVCWCAYYTWQTYQNASQQSYHVEYIDVPPQKSRECGINAVVNAIVLANPELKAQHAALIEAARQQIEAARAAAAQASPASSSSSSSAPATQPAQQRIPLQAADLDIQEVQSLLNHIRDHGIGGQHPTAANIIAVQDETNVPAISRLPESMIKSFQGLRSGNQAQVCILYLGGLNYGGYGHWVAVHLVPSPQSFGGIRACVADSMGSWFDRLFNYVNPNLSMLLNFYRSDNPIIGQLPQGFNFQKFSQSFQKVEGVEGILGDSVHGTDQAKVDRGGGALVGGFRDLSSMQLDATAYPTWKRIFERSFEALKKYCLAKNLTLNHGGQQFAMDQATTFDQFIGWCRDLPGN